jgi:hypothetical protein
MGEFRRHRRNRKLEEGPFADRRGQKKARGSFESRPTNPGAEMMLDNVGSEAGWEQQDQAEKERWQLTVDALDAARAGTATQEQVRWLARECGITEYKGDEQCQRLAK